MVFGALTYDGVHGMCEERNAGCLFSLTTVNISVT